MQSRMENTLHLNFCGAQQLVIGFSIHENIITMYYRQKCLEEMVVTKFLIDNFKNNDIPVDYLTTADDNNHKIQHHSNSRHIENVEHTHLVFKKDVDSDILAIFRALILDYQDKNNVKNRKIVQHAFYTHRLSMAKAVPIDYIITDPYPHDPIIKDKYLKRILDYYKDYIADKKNTLNTHNIINILNENTSLYQLPITTSAYSVAQLRQATCPEINNIADNPVRYIGNNTSSISSSMLAGAFGAVSIAAILAYSIFKFMAMPKPANQHKLQIAARTNQIRK